MTVTGSSATIAADFKNAFYDAVVQLLDGQRVLVSFGTPGTWEPDEIVAVGRVSESQDQATMGTNRSREEVIELEVVISVARGGGPEMERVCSDRCYEILRLIERHFRMDDVTVGGTVRECFLKSHDSAGATAEELLAHGRVIDITAIFEARNRVRA